MDDLMIAVGQLLVRCGESACELDAHTDGGPLRDAAAKVAGLLPRFAARPDADRAAVLLLNAGATLYGEANDSTAGTEQWREDRDTALEILGVVTLTPAK